MRTLSHTADQFPRAKEYAPGYQGLESRMFETKIILQYLCETPKSTVHEISENIRYSTGDVEIVLGRLSPILMKEKIGSMKTYSVDPQKTVILRHILQYLSKKQRSTVNEIIKGTGYGTEDVEKVLTPLRPIFREGKKGSLKTYSVDAEYLEIWNYVLRILEETQRGIDKGNIIKTEENA